jgi:hypothetical protein
MLPSTTESKIHPSVIVLFAELTRSFLERLLWAIHVWPTYCYADLFVFVLSAAWSWPRPKTKETKPACPQQMAVSHPASQTCAKKHEEIQTVIEEESPPGTLSA